MVKNSHLPFTATTRYLTIVFCLALCGQGQLFAYDWQTVNVSELGLPSTGKALMHGTPNIIDGVPEGPAWFAIVGNEDLAIRASAHRAVLNRWGESTSFVYNFSLTEDVSSHPENSTFLNFSGSVESLYGQAWAEYTAAPTNNNFQFPSMEDIPRLAAQRGISTHRYMAETVLNYFDVVKNQPLTGLYTKDSITQTRELVVAQPQSFAKKLNGENASETLFLEYKQLSNGAVIGVYDADFTIRASIHATRNEAGDITSISFIDC